MNKNILDIYAATGQWDKYHELIRLIEGRTMPPPMGVLDRDQLYSGDGAVLLVARPTAYPATDALLNGTPYVPYGVSPEIAVSTVLFGLLAVVYGPAEPFGILGVAALVLLNLLCESRIR